MCSVESVESYYLMFQRFTLQGNVNKMYKITPGSWLPEMIFIHSAFAAYAARPLEQ